MEAEHPSRQKAQAIWDVIAKGELAGLDDQADDIVVENGPGAGPWRVVQGKEAFVTFVISFISFFQGTWHQDGRCVYGDDRCTVSLVHETGSGPDGDKFDNMAIWISRFDAEGNTDRLWTVDLDQEHVTDFWDRNEAALKKTLST